MKTMYPPSYYRKGLMVADGKRPTGNDVCLRIAGTNEPKSTQKAEQGA